MCLYTDMMQQHGLAGGAANWAPHRAERGPYTGPGASTVGLFAVTGPAYDRSRMNSRMFPLG